MLPTFSWPHGRSFTRLSTPTPGKRSIYFAQAQQHLLLLFVWTLCIVLKLRLLHFSFFLGQIVFVENKKLTPTLLEDIDEAQLPDIYGGKMPLTPIQDSHWWMGLLTTQAPNSYHQIISLIFFIYWIKLLKRPLPTYNIVKNKKPNL